MTLKQWCDSHISQATTYTPEDYAQWVLAYFQDQDRKAVAAFNAAFLKLQGVLPTIDEKGVITYKDGRTGTYALNEDIQDAILPILQAHGFTLHFETGTEPNPLLMRAEDGSVAIATLRVTGILTHKRGHSRRSTFEAPADRSGGKNVGQARGSVMSYGHRYTTVDLLNLVTRGADNDGVGFKFSFDASQLDAHAKPVFRKLVESACEGTLEECWKALDTSERASVGFECFSYVKQLAGYVR